MTSRASIGGPAIFRRSAGGQSAVSTPLTRRECAALLALGGASLLTNGRSASAQPASSNDFYLGKSIEMIIGYPPGGANDLYGRAVAAHLPRFIPGTPKIVPKNMPGAGSLVAAAYMYNKASADGTAIGIAAPTLPLDERLGSLDDRAKPSQLSWIGRVNTVNLVIFVRSGSLASIKDAFTEVATLSATGVGSALTIYPHALNAIVGTKFKLILGYKGSAEGMLAVDRSEVDGHCTGWDAFKAAHLDWFKSGKIRVLVQFAMHRHPELPDVPTAVELATSPRQAALMKAVISGAEVGMSFFAPPRVSDERLAVLRTAFDQCMKDAAFKAHLDKLNMGLDPLTGDVMSKVVADVKDIPDDLIPELKRAYSVAK
jgi:tripartite-type tricarboxylate transporter receptor subunit TctC